MIVLNSNIFIWRDKHMIRLAICDDDNENMSYMKEKINEAFIKSGYNDEIIYNLFNTGEELVNAHIANKLDIVFCVLTTLLFAVNTFVAKSYSVSITLPSLSISNSGRLLLSKKT